ncbi:MAG: hypothetical protein B7Z55_05115 [Planctomycetales bacterium 12-60-4]|nr:MAG: hypothetical protein B7Z55_05115 [Planctomycetales bacterium 12-60-4]
MLRFQRNRSCPIGSRAWAGAVKLPVANRAKVDFGNLCGRCLANPARFAVTVKTPMTVRGSFPGQHAPICVGNFAQIQSVWPQHP